MLQLNVSIIAEIADVEDRQLVDMFHCISTTGYIEKNPADDIFPGYLWVR